MRNSSLCFVSSAESFRKRTRIFWCLEFFTREFDVFVFDQRDAEVADFSVANSRGNGGIVAVELASNLGECSIGGVADDG